MTNLSGRLLRLNQVGLQDREPRSKLSQNLLWFGQGQSLSRVVLDLTFGLLHFLLNTFNFLGDAGFQVGHAGQPRGLFSVPADPHLQRHHHP